MSSAGGKVAFHSDMAGDISVDWAKIKEIRTAQKFAVLEKGVKPSRKTPDSLVPQGTITVADQKVEVHPESGTAPAPIPVSGNIDFLVEDGTYHSKVDHDPGFFHAWHGTATAGGTIVQATQDTYTFNAAVTLARVIPDVTWLAPRNRTTTDFGDLREDHRSWISSAGIARAASHSGDVCPGNHGEDVDLSLRLRTR